MGVAEGAWSHLDRFFGASADSKEGVWSHRERLDFAGSEDCAASSSAVCADDTSHLFLRFLPAETAVLLIVVLQCRLSNIAVFFGSSCDLSFDLTCNLLFFLLEFPSRHDFAVARAILVVAVGESIGSNRREGAVEPALLVVGLAIGDPVALLATARQGVVFLNAVAACELVNHVT
ncbi:hypothetical protein Ct61P_01479 [Colletotrichum tofieldiae]|nr:hypothetical protein Ct61P_01479 [Colletotrichum tofieldiae]